MSCVASMTEYIGKALSTVSGMKALLLDQYTSGMTALVLSQTDVINREVFLTDRIDLLSAKTGDTLPQLNSRGEFDSSSSSSSSSSSKDTFHHLRAVAFIRPCASSVSHLKSVMKSNKFKDYYIFFSNIVPSDDLLRSIAESDEYEYVRNVTEIYADYYAVNDFVYELNLTQVKPLYAVPNYWSSEEKTLLERNSEGIISLLLSFKVRADIRYSGGSDLAKLLAMDIMRRQKDESDLFTFQTQSPLLLILDRTDDPVTPLLSQWTYQAMVHELIGIKNNRISLAHVKGISKDNKEVVLTPHQDHFYKGSQFLNFGDLGISIKELVQNFQRKTQNHARLDTIADMQAFVDNYPEFRQMSGTVSKHVAIMTELSEIVGNRQLMRLSEFEQELACSQDHTSAMDKLLGFMEANIDWSDKLRLVMLYALRYENQRPNQIPQFKKMLRDKAQMDSSKLQRVRAIDALLKHAGAAKRGGDLFGNKSLLSSVGTWMKSGLKGVENIYTQHKPLLAETLNLLTQNKLKTTAYPYTDSASANNGAKAKYRLILVYVIGGLTYEEVLAVENFNNANSGIRVVIGGNCIHNSTSFINDLLSGAPEHDQYSLDVAP